jgi:squalene cyclase
MNDERFQLLAEKFLEGSLGDDEARELLEAPPGRLLDEVALAGLLARTGRPSADLTDRVRAALRPPAEKEALLGRVLERLPARRVPRWLLPLAAAAGLAFAAGLVVLIHGEPAARPAARGFSPEPAAKAAIARGVEFLRRSQVPSGSWNGPVPAEEIALLALLHAGVPQDDPKFQGLLAKALARKPERTYTVSLHAVLLAELDPVKHRGRIAESARWLVENQAKDGRWAYTTPSPVLDPKKADAGSPNNSCSLFAVMGLRAAIDAGVAVPRATLVRARDAWRSLQRPDRDVQFGRDRAGWCYTRDEDEHHPYGSMTAGGLAALITLDALLGEEWRNDPAVRAGMNWLTYHFTAFENYGPVEELMAKEVLSDTPHPKTEFYYYLWALERVGALTGSAKVGEHDWYAEGLQEILATQRPDGSWYSGVKRCNPVWDTCYAILFLTRSTRPLAR